jgi:hypothetical protein
MDLATELQAIYDSEINVEIGWFWDCGITVRLGDPINGFLAEHTVSSVAGIVPWLQEVIAHFYPDSTYAKTLDPGIGERARGMLFRPPGHGVQVKCPHCGAPNAGPPTDEVLAFYCARCGNSTKFDRRKVQ